ncbi:cytochrome c [Candidatus Peregrinibacteria bacterium]|nr:cytochrome c [Candidatus Peregrinibacteria bacterium]
MKISIFLIVLLLCSCTAQTPNRDRVAALEQKLVELKPGLGEIMGIVQQHHAKLFYSGTRGNWELAQYQIDEIKEGLEDVAKYYPTFKEVKLPLKDLIPKMMDEPLRNVASAIQKKDAKAFKTAFAAMTKSCNSCHQAAEHGFIVIQAPIGQEFTNQQFSP